MPVSSTLIANNALRKLGASRIEALDDDDANARTMNSAYDTIRRRLLRQHPWNFAIVRASLPALSDETTWGELNRFQLPSGFLRLLRNTEAGTFYDETRKNWKIEGDVIVTMDSAPLEIRYVADIEDTTKFDAFFVDLFSTVLAFDCCEEITGSTTKREGLREDIRTITREAKQANAFENDGEDPAYDDWLAARL